MNVNEFNSKVKQLVSLVDAPMINARLTLSGLNLIKNRIINEGKDHNGKSYAKYSENRLPFYFFAGKSLSGGTDKKLESFKKKQQKSKEEKGISYIEWRRLNGLQTKHVDMKFTGETLRDIQVLETRLEGGVVITEAGTKNSITKPNGKKKVTTGQVTEFLSDRYGDFLTLSQQETEALDEALDDEIQQLIDKIFI